MTIAAEVTEEIKITLTLGKREVYYLKALLQNDVTGQEDDVSREIRSDIFHALPSFEKLL